MDFCNLLRTLYCYFLFYLCVAEHEKEVITELKKQHEEKVNELLRQLEMTERTLEEEKQSLLHDLAQGKTAAINLMQVTR